MPAALSSLLEQTIQHELPLLLSLTDAAASRRPGGESSWSPKEELGHLIDSASNNHIRIVLAAIQGEFHGPTYAQNAWVNLHGYSEIDWGRIVDLWFSYNTLLIALIARIPAEKLSIMCYIGEAGPCSLRFLIEDYILHLKHHVDHMLQRENITVYPSQKLPSGS